MSDKGDDELNIQRDFLEVFGTPQGARVLRTILKFCAMDEVIITQSDTIALMAMGAKNVGTRILLLMDKDVAEIPQITRRRR